MTSNVSDLYNACLIKDIELLNTKINEDPLNWVRAVFITYYNELKKDFHARVKNTEFLNQIKPDNLKFDPNWFSLENNPLGKTSDILSSFNNIENRNINIWFHDESLWSFLYTKNGTQKNPFFKFNTNNTGSSSIRFFWKAFQEQSKELIKDNSNLNFEIWLYNFKQIEKFDFIKNKIKTTTNWLKHVNTFERESLFYRAIPSQPMQALKIWKNINHKYPMASYIGYSILDKTIDISNDNSFKFFIKKIETLAKSVNYDIKNDEKECLIWLLNTYNAKSYTLKDYEQSTVISTLGDLQSCLNYFRKDTFQNLEYQEIEMDDFNF